MENTVKSKSQQQIDSIIRQAKREPVKGRYYVYERYKAQFRDICEDSIQYERACIALANALKV